MSSEILILVRMCVKMAVNIINDSCTDLIKVDSDTLSKPRDSLLSLLELLCGVHNIGRWHRDKLFGWLKVIFGSLLDSAT